MSEPLSERGASEWRTGDIAQMRRRVAVYVFSYNRAHLLDHALETVALNMTGFDVFLIDDNSEDLETKQVLSKWSVRIPTLEVGNEIGERKTGGLYVNMNRALRHACDEGYEYALFTQDDMQFIRPFDLRDAALVEDYFAAHQNVIQLLVHFIKRPLSGGELAEHWTPDDSGTSYLRKELDSNSKSAFCAGGIFHVSRTVEAIKSFAMSEAENSEQLRAKGYYYGVSHAPLICFMPAPISFRGKRRNLEHRFYEILGGAGFHPVEQMSDDEIERFWNRERLVFPVAEDFLHCSTAPAPENWAAGGGAYLVLARGGWRRVLYDIIAFTKMIIKRALGK